MAKKPQDVLGNTSLTQFDVCIVGSGAGGGTAAHVLTAGGKNVLVLEAGPNLYPDLDKAKPITTLHSNDELKYESRNLIDQISMLEPRTFRFDEGSAAAVNADVNLLPRAVGGAFQHADCKTPRFTAVDFLLKTKMEAAISANPGLAVPGFGSDAASANFADWPFTYDDLEPFYSEAEQLYGVQGDTSNPFASPVRSKPYPMPPGVPMYLSLVIKAGAEMTTFFGSPLHPHPFPAAITSQFYDDRPPCVDCGLCSGFGCPNNAKGSPAVTTLRKALLSGRCQLRYNAHVSRLVNTGTHVTGVEYFDGQGSLQTATADAFILAASPIESARLCFLSGSNGDALGNSSGQVGRNLMFHFQTNVNAFLPNRVHGQRGRAVTHGLSDFRGVMPGGAEIRVLDDGGTPRVAMGGICEFGGPQGLPITEDGETYAFSLGVRYGQALKDVMRDAPLGQHLFGMIMQAEDAPQLTNRVDLDPTVQDVFGLPVPRVTYKNHPYETQARTFYAPFMHQILTNAGGTHVFTAPCDALLGGPPTSRHILGTLRMGSDPATSVLNPQGRFHDVDNLYACDGSTFVTSGGWNPTLTIMAVALKIAHGIAGTQPG